MNSKQIGCDLYIISHLWKCFVHIWLNEFFFVSANIYFKFYSDRFKYNHSSYTNIITKKQFYLSKNININIKFS